MNKPKWTVEQEAAIKLRGQILVAAAAGSGKTAVLVERLIRRIIDPEEPEDVDRFLVVTFTKAAANEMRERIGKALDDALFNAQDTREVERLLRQRSLLQQASIMTLHSFCLELIRKYFYQLELDPAFRVADQAEADLLQQDVVEDLFETKYECPDPAFLKLVDAFGSDRDDRPLMEYILHLYEFACSQPHPAEWLGKLDKAYKWENVDSLMQSAWGQAIRQGLLDLVDEIIVLLERAEQITQQPGGPAPYAITLQDDLNRVRLFKRTLREGQWAQVGAQFQSAVTFPKLPAIRSKTRTSTVSVTDSNVSVPETLQKPLQEECKKLRDEAKQKLKSLKEDVFAYPLEEQLPALGEMAALAQTLGGLVLEFSQLYAVKKEQRNVLDFTDLEHLALQLLEEKGEASMIAQGLKDYFQEVLVDEYQDINPVQERILQLVSRQGEFPNLFMVGDVKQSIYRFRMADPGLFLAKYRTLPHWQPEMPGSTAPVEMVIDLKRNFRSRLEVVEGVNFLFRQIMTKGAGEIPYDDQAALQYGASFVSGQEQIRTAEGPIEVHLIDTKSIKNRLTVIPAANKRIKDADDPTAAPMEGDSTGEDKSTSGTEEAIPAEDLEKARLEARLVGERIQRIVREKEFMIYDKKLEDFRAVCYSDIVILMRSYSAVAPIYLEEFQNAKIPVYAETTSGYFGASEVETMLSLLKVIDNPHQDIPLAAVLRSPIVGLHGGELGKIRMILPEGDFFEALTLAVWAGLSDENLSQEKIDDFTQILGLYEESLTQRLEKARLILAEAPTLLDKITDFWCKLQTWRTRSRRTSLADLLWSLYEESGYLTYVGTLPAGAQRQANLRILYDRAGRFEATRYRGLFRFLRFLERFQGQGKDLGNARALGETEDVVRLMTVHGSKGLEFPVVFVVGLGRKFNTVSMRGKMLLHAQLGVGMPLIDIENNVRYPSVILYALKQRLAQESLAEELRILYVALTRAQERLFLIGNVDDWDKTLLKWQRNAAREEVALPDGQLRSAKCFLDWIGPALVRHPAHFFGEAEGQKDLSIPEINSRWEVQIHHDLPDSTNEDAMVNPEEEIDERIVAGQDLSDAACSEKGFAAGSDQVSERMDEGFDPAQKEEIVIEQKESGEAAKAAKATEADEAAEADQVKTVELWFSEVDRRLSWQYPYQNAVRQVAKTSVSELKRQFYRQADEEATLLSALWQGPDFLKRPRFLQTDKPLTAAERGTAMHTAMQHLPFQKWAPYWKTLAPAEQSNYINEFLNKLEEQEILSKQQKDSIHSEQICRLLSSQLGERLFGAEQILREVPFTLTFPSEEQANILVQGVIDVVLLSKDENSEMQAEILDYKTDSFHSLKNEINEIVENSETAAPEQILLKRYSLQLSVYALSIERLLKIKVSRCTLYSFALGREIDISDKMREIIQTPGFPFNEHKLFYC